MSTFFVTDERMLRHKCEWDPHHIERPERLSRILSQLKASSRGIFVVRRATAEYGNSRRVHAAEEPLCHHRRTHDRPRRGVRTQNREHGRVDDGSLDCRLIEVIVRLQKEQEDFSSGYEDIYVNESTWEAATLSAGCALELTAAVWKEGRGANGFAAIRPPGHHAWRDQVSVSFTQHASERVIGLRILPLQLRSTCGQKSEFNPFISFRILPLEQALADGAERVLIVDFDVHAGQGTQYAIADDSRIRLISIHR